MVKSFFYFTVLCYWVKTLKFIFNGYRHNNPLVSEIPIYTVKKKLTHMWYSQKLFLHFCNLDISVCTSSRIFEIIITDLRLSRPRLQLNRRFSDVCRVQFAVADDCLQDASSGRPIGVDMPPATTNSTHHTSENRKFNFYNSFSVTDYFLFRYCLLLYLMHKN